MGDFASGFSNNLKGNVIPKKEEVFDRKIDKQRETFLKGISSTKHGKKEDPTYLYFRLIFDFGVSGEIDPETFLAPSPLFREEGPAKNYEDRAKNAETKGFKDAQNNAGSTVTGAGNSQGDAGNENPIGEQNSGNFNTDQDFFYGSKFRHTSDPYTQFSAYPTGDNSYMGAQEFLKQRSIKRKDMIKKFKLGLDFINKKSPYYFQSINGLENLVKGGIKNYFKDKGSDRRAGTLTIECLESIDMRISAIAELYRKAIFDYTHHRTMLPENLRKFRMYIVVTEIRNIKLTGNNINDILNPFNIPSVAQGANFLDSFNTQTGLLDDAQGALGKSTKPDTSLPGVTDTSEYELQPYFWMYQLDLCEFDFDDTYPSFASIDNKGGSAVSTSFKINVGKVKDHKIQYNELSDILGKKDNVRGMVISDIFGSTRAGYNEFDYVDSVVDGEPPPDVNPGAYFGQLASNFINNSVGDLVNRGVSIAQGAILGNAYGLGGINVGQATSSVQSLVNTFQGGIPNPFTKNDPQSKGFGGPPERQYPDPNTDVYPGVPGESSENLGNVLPDGSSGGENLTTDVYSDVPGTDLGLPDRQYPNLSDDEYNDVPGTDLGVPDYPYNTPQIKGDAYDDVPGSDLGLPDRQYPNLSDDEYNDVPGTDLGVPGRTYDEPSEDIYSTSEGEDLGLPDRIYPQSTGDEYSDVPGADLGTPGRVYDEPNGDVYEDTPGSDLGLPDREYPNIGIDEYEDVPGKDLGKPDRTYSEPDPNKDVYEDIPGPELGLPDREYPNPTKDEYKSVPGKDLGKPDRVYSQPTGDVYPTSEGSDLGLPNRQYPEISGATDEYKTNPGVDLGVPGRTYDRVNEKVYNDQIPDYKGTEGANEYDSINTSKDTPSEDVYTSNPGKDLGLPDRNYSSNNDDEYIQEERDSQKPLGRVYPKTDNFRNLNG
jgi:hypothetical protein